MTAHHTVDATIDDLAEYVGYRGKCARTSPTRHRDRWYDIEPPRGRYSPREQAHRARIACAGCPVTTECLQVALAIEAQTKMHWGYWGGTSPNERRQMLRRTDAADSAA